MRTLTTLTLAASATVAAGLAGCVEADNHAWLGWRGPMQNGTSIETGLPDTVAVDGANHLWTYDLPGRGTPVVGNGRIYAMGYEGEGIDVEEMIICFDEATGERVWERRFTDFLSDSIYSRYAIGSPAIDAETGQVYCLTTPGLLCCFTPDGDLLWQRSMMEQFGRLTFPNGRTGAPVIDEDLVITHVISANWGKLGPARDRFYAFDKKTGELVWVSTPGLAPKDSSFSKSVLALEKGRKVLYAGTGCGHLVCIDARTGEPLWRFQMSIGGVNSSPVLTPTHVIQIHGRENLDASAIGRMIAVPRDQPIGGDEILALGPGDETWRNELGIFTSSPVLVGNRVYQTVHTGDLACVDASTGEILWHEKLAPDQIHASPVYADGKLYVPMNNGSFYIIRPSDEGPEILAKVQLAGNCLGAPAVANGRVYVHTTEKLYCFGGPGGVGSGAVTAIRGTPQRAFTDDEAQLQIVPYDSLVRAGDRVPVQVRTLDERGRRARDGVEVTWAASPRLDAEVRDGELVIPDDAKPGAGELTASYGDLTGNTRVRIVPRVPFAHDFDGFDVSTPHPLEEGVQFAFPPSHWIGGRLKWEVRDRDGEQVLARTLDRALFQRSVTFMGHPDETAYTMQVDILSDGNRRTMSTAGVINQRYQILLKGNHQQIEVNSNHERLKQHVQFRWRANEWYTLKARVEPRDDGTTLILAKAWPRDEAEPAEWHLRVEDPHGHRQGAPGIIGFAPQSRFRVFIDNLQVTKND